MSSRKEQGQLKLLILNTRHEHPNASVDEIHRLVTAKLKRLGEAGVELLGASM